MPPYFSAAPTGLPHRGIPNFRYLFLGICGMINRALQQTDRCNELTHPLARSLARCARASRFTTLDITIPSEFFESLLRFYPSLLPRVYHAKPPSVRSLRVSFILCHSIFRSHTYVYIHTRNARPCTTQTSPHFNERGA